jgi:hypothetical protein
MAPKTNPETPLSDDRPKTRKNDSSSAPSGEEEYRVGPGRPPREYQWKKGESGNPKGRKRKEPPVAPELKELFLRAFNRKATMNDGDHQQLVTMFDAGMQQLAVQFGKGDRYARRDALWLMKEFGIDLSKTSTTTDQPLPADRQAILDAYVERQTQERSTCASSPVLAPPELLDDDAPDDPNER